VETTREHFIEGIAERVNVTDWTVSFTLSPVELEGQYSIIGVDVIGPPKVIGW
jgi:hypothetical protein